MLVPPGGPHPYPAGPTATGRRYDEVEAKAVVATLFAAAGLLGVPLQVVPLWDGADRHRLGLLTVASLASAVVLPRLRVLPYRFAVLLTASGNVLIALAQYWSGPAVGSATFGAVYALTLAAAFLLYSTKVLVAQAALAVLAQCTVLVALGQAGTAAASVAVTMGAGCGSGIVARRLANLRAQAEEELAWSATHDGLTGLPNRVALATAWLGMSAVRPVSGLVLDLRGFKQVNDVLGHHYGDAVLVQVGARLAALPAPAFACRLGGDEFAVLLPGADEAAARESAEHVRRFLSEPYDVSGTVLPLSATVGSATVGDPGEDTAGDASGAGAPVEALSALLAAADSAMYYAREVGRGTASAAELPADPARRVPAQRTSAPTTA